MRGGCAHPPLIHRDASDIQKRMVKPASCRSDDFTLVSHEIPALRFTTGEHADYHRPSDTVDRVNVAGLVRVIDYVERVARLVDR